MGRTQVLWKQVSQQNMEGTTVQHKVYRKICAQHKSTSQVHKIGVHDPSTKSQQNPSQNRNTKNNLLPNNRKHPTNQQPYVHTTETKPMGSNNCPTLRVSLSSSSSSHYYHAAFNLLDRNHTQNLKILISQLTCWFLLPLLINLITFY